MAGEIVVRKRHEGRGEHVQRKDDLHPQAEPGPATEPAGMIHLPPNYTGSSEQNAKARGSYTSLMFPVSDVIPSKTTPYVTVSLIALNALVFLYQLQLDSRGVQLVWQLFGLIPAYFSWTTVLTSMFLHEGWLHLLGNMLYLWIFGDNIEDSLGHLGFLLFYLFCGAAAVLGQVAIAPASTLPMIGASGAIAGVMGAYFVIYPHSRVLTIVFLVFFLDMIEIPAIFFLGIWFVKELFNGVGSLGTRSMNGGVAVWAHIAGFAAGGLVGFLWRLRHATRRPYWE